MGTVIVVGLLVFALEEVTERRIPDLNIGVEVPFVVVDRTRVARIETEGMEHTEASRRWENMPVGKEGHGTIPWLGSSNAVRNSSKTRMWYRRERLELVELVDRKHLIKMLAVQTNPGECIPQ
ncbi:hypothetical protein PsorP6_001904 [Peronosclerospora sorghi]|uniref:Uncharacterized protein n=1 Tax=Peronosclerospora sorghi TaxID=230839 RepID=A0ACC0WVE0_9STRA|nr:hypothetical protein PsorP6_001904 [Peronosclerospora sorghi]